MNQKNKLEIAEEILKLHGRNLNNYITAMKMFNKKNLNDVLEIPSSQGNMEKMLEFADLHNAGFVKTDEVKKEGYMLVELTKKGKELYRK